jgi:hypothetical protein
MEISFFGAIALWGKEVHLIHCQIRLRSLQWRESSDSLSGKRVMEGTMTEAT